MAKVVINHNGFQRMRKFVYPPIEDDRDLAGRVGVSRATISRVFAGKIPPSNRFIGGALQTFGHSWFNELFKVEP